MELLKLKDTPTRVQFRDNSVNRLACHLKTTVWTDTRLFSIARTNDATFLPLNPSDAGDRSDANYLANQLRISRFFSWNSVRWLIWRRHFYRDLRMSAARFNGYREKFSIFPLFLVNELTF